MRCALLAFFLLLGPPANSWGFQAHRTINYHAVFLLPNTLFSYYKPYIDILAKEATKADQRRYLVKDEGMKHYIDLDQFEVALPLDTIAVEFDSAVTLFGLDSLHEHGILPWNILKTFHRLKWAFLKQETEQILRYSADLGHYIADAHVPLHTTSNYNGQLSGQDGIHALWESRLPELFMADYAFFNEKATYIDSPLTAIWSWITESHSALDSVLSFELASKKRFPLAHGFEIKAGRTHKVYHADFCAYYHKSLDHMVERRMKGAMHAIASMWYTAWRDAGQLLPSESDSVYFLPESISQKPLNSPRNHLH